MGQPRRAVLIHPAYGGAVDLPGAAPPRSQASEGGEGLLGDPSTGPCPHPEPRLTWSRDITSPPLDPGALNPLHPWGALE